MKNPLKFIQEVKQETFRITWPTKKDTMMGAVMVFALASIAAIDARPNTIIAPIIVSFFVGHVILKVSCLTS